MNKSDFNYFLPEHLIAQTPISPRDSSKLLVYDKNKDTLSHKVFRDILDYLKQGDVLVINNTRVLPARLMGKTINGGVIEILLLKRKNLTDWEVLVKPGKKAKEGVIFYFSDELSCEILSRTEDGGRIVSFKFEGVFEDIISRVGSMPLPHYIKEELKEKERYQTVYNKIDGSSAAPTAGLHFTNELLAKIKNKGVEVVEVLLHVGLGTFRPVKTDNILDHKMHSEYFSISEESCEKINKAKTEKRRVIAVGTTSVRTLESSADENGLVKSESRDTSIFIYPSYKFKCVDAIITNFHLPESTLIMLISAFVNREKILDIYKTAVEEEYRFFSFGDAMFIY